MTPLIRPGFPTSHCCPFSCLLFLHMGCFPSHVWWRSTNRLTLSLPEDPCAHELEEAAGIKPGPVHRDGVLGTGREDVRVCDQIKGPLIKAAVSDLSRESTYAIVHQGFPRMFQLFNESGEKQNKRKPCHKCIHLPNNFPFMLHQTWDSSPFPLGTTKLRLFFSYWAENTSKFEVI